MLIDSIFSISNSDQFEQIALDIFRFQAKNCNPYAQFIKNLGVSPEKIDCLAKIPYLPISFFKTHKIVSTAIDPVRIFTSSGTTGQQQSRHYVTDLSLYEKSFNLAFEQFYGNPGDFCILALLPSYMEREGSSLIYMVDSLLSQSKHPASGYFLHNHQELYEQLIALKNARQQTILIGVTYALLDFLEKYQIDFPELIIMETGGMKGKRKEMVREELHAVLKQGFGVPAIHSEYGMTELLSQAYSLGEGIFECPQWMKIVLRDTNDPLSLVHGNQTGGINIIDLANINSCAFIATQDLGRVYSNGTFEVLGRFDNADIRGCNLLIQ
ncbi:acyl transferase [Pedobacter antarcticus 4BY]|uniref:Acyl transferase n=2 Tax=Pedobacter antarcticus TaxID=34086 RepID=A0A081PH95_9SPHI|nr:acyltransferase [Pedobacter antarcticus]KEQ30068.1 acyl transferase [Pedobacter antarcticus 4BY]SFF39413.1 Acyl-protein synthetase, LuxE [Pedobacter antarcticus]